MSNQDMTGKETERTSKDQVFEPLYRIWHKEWGCYLDDPSKRGNSKINKQHLGDHLFLSPNGRVFWSQHDGIEELTGQVEVHWQNKLAEHLEEMMSDGCQLIHGGNLIDWSDTKIPKDIREQKSSFADR